MSGLPGFPMTLGVQRTKMATDLTGPLKVSHCAQHMSIRGWIIPNTNQDSYRAVAPAKTLIFRNDGAAIFAVVLFANSERSSETSPAME
ncbi:hypothetical protein EAG_05480 [Camponotus floridanus]|uniref:Uncharacterized protein n=1 Tax=Camponotus floridanus TaxID=104421 RepID=E2ARD9_CAMFO|nr:hypothetical protein EAG_05480 [Camponotus floridanus]